MRTFAVSRLKELRKLLAHPESVNEARSLLTAQVGRSTFWPVAGEEKWHYEANGSVGFFGEDEIVRVGGAGGRESSQSRQAGTQTLSSSNGSQRRRRSR